MALVFSVILLSLLADTTHSDVTCTSKGTRQHVHCQVEDCTVEANTPLRIICGSCPEGDSESPDCNKTQWSKWDWNTFDYQPLDEYAGKGIIYLSADEVTKELSNQYYMCTCLCKGSLTGSFLGLTVNSEKPSGKPHLTVRNYTVNGNSSYSLPTIATRLTRSDKGRICIDATSTGTQDLKYTWYCYLEEEGDYFSLDNSDSVCGVGAQIVTKNIPASHLCILPTVHLCQKKNKIQRYKVKVSNDFGSIKVFATVEFPDLSKCGAFSWFIEPHQIQSHGNITVGDDGTGTAFSAANQQESDGELQFSLCEVDSDETSISAYYSNNDEKKCIICGENKNFNYSIITNHLGTESRACLVKIKNPRLGQKYSCIVKRVLGERMNGLALQHQELSDPQELGTFEFTDDKSASEFSKEDISHPEMTPLIVISSVVVAAVGVLSLIAIALGIFAYRRHKNKAPGTVPVDNEQTDQENWAGTIANTHAEISPTESWRNGQAVSDAVRRMHKQLIRSLNIDAPLLAAMNERRLLSQVNLEKIQAMISNGTVRCEIASYFIDNILLCWAPGVFVDQLELFRDALDNHDDRSNKRFAVDFNKLLKTSKTHSFTSSSANYLMLTESWRNGQAVSDGVRGMQEQLTRSLNIDASLLAAMNERGLLSQTYFEELQSMLSKGTPRLEIASHFISCILLRWAPGVFVDQLEHFRDALANHDDRSNKQFAEDFDKLLKTPKSHSLSTSNSAKY